MMDDEIIKEAKKSNASAYLQKPVEADSLITTIQRIVNSEELFLVLENDYPFVFKESLLDALNKMTKTRLHFKTENSYREEHLSNGLTIIMGIIGTVLVKGGDMLIGFGMDKAGEWLKNKGFGKKEISIEEIKKKAQVLFVDDESYEGRMTAIRDAGWNARQINDVKNFDSEEIKNADIIFMDFKGVGSTLSPTEEGIGLLKQLKKRYSNKVFIFYSGYAGFIPGHEVHGIADAWIPKNSDTIVYIDIIEESAKKIYDK